MRIENRVWVSSRCVLLAVLLVFAVLVLVPVRPVRAQAQTGPRYVTFDAPGAVWTEPIGEAQPGVIMGYAWDMNFVPHGFLRYPDGRFTIFDVPGAANGTAVNGANMWGTISGVYRDENMARHAYVRSPFGKFTFFDIKTAGASNGQGTWPANINALGLIGGYYVDAAYVYHGFVRTPDGWITRFDAPGAGTSAGQGTWTGAYKYLNIRGELTGYYLDASGVCYGFLRHPNGRVNTIDDPFAGHSNATGSGQGTQPEAINDAGIIVGLYQDSNDEMHSFLRTPEGKFTTIDDPLALTGYSWSGTYAWDVNGLGEIDGNYYDANWMWHGFLRTPLGKFITIDPPGSDETDVCTITSTGAIVGYYWDDATQTYRGFLCYPGPWWKH